VLLGLCVIYFISAKHKLESYDDKHYRYKGKSINLELLKFRYKEIELLRRKYLKGPKYII
jgi:hypothetical protein